MSEKPKGSEIGTPDILSYASCIPGTSDSEVGQYFRERLGKFLEEAAGEAEG